MPFAKGSKIVCNPCGFVEDSYVCTNAKNFAYEHQETERRQAADPPREADDRADSEKGWRPKIVRAWPPRRQGPCNAIPPLYGHLGLSPSAKPKCRKGFARPGPWRPVPRVWRQGLSEVRWKGPAIHEKYQTPAQTPRPLTPRLSAWPPRIFSDWRF